MHRLLLLAAALLLTACSTDPAVHLTASDHAEHHRPENLAEVMDGSMRSGLLTCYRELETTAVGTVVLDVSGSHGLLDVVQTSGSGDEALDRCAVTTLKGGRLMREVGDTEGHIGFVLTVRFEHE